MKLIKRLFIVIFLCLPCFLLAENIKKTSTPIERALQSDKIYKGFSGGMYVHLGYIKSAKFSLYDGASSTFFPEKKQINDLTYGIGGVLKFFIGKYFRLGFEGYASTSNYEKIGSKYKLGWGGLLVDCYYPLGRFLPYVGLTIGGGGVSNLSFVQVSPTYKEVLYDKYTTFLITPFVGVEYMLTDRINCSFKVDFICDVLGEHDSFAWGPRFYLGIIFSNLKF